MAEKCHIEERHVVYVKGWPQKSTRPYHVYRGTKFLGGYASRAAALKRVYAEDAKV